VAYQRDLPRVIASVGEAISGCTWYHQTRLPRSHAVGVVARNDDGEAECSVVRRQWIPASGGFQKPQTAWGPTG